MVRLLARGGSNVRQSSNAHHYSPSAAAAAAAAAATKDMVDPNDGGGGRGPPRSRFARDGPPADIDLMKEKFAKLLLGEDMSGSGKGVSSALALSNAITNLAASVFGEHRRLEPLAEDNKTRWKKEVDWLLSVTDHIVEFVPTHQPSADGSAMEVMSTQQRRDLAMNVPALRKLDAMLIGYMDNFKDQTEFWYEKGGDNKRKDDKWWMPTVKVPEEGLSEVIKKWLLYQKDCVNQVLKAAMAINAQVLMEIEVPDIYIDSLPKNGKVSLGDAIYKNITSENFDPGMFLESMDLTTEHKVLDLKNRIEASTVIWKRKMTSKEAKSSWGSFAGVGMDRREQFEDRAETILLLLKQQFPGIPQSTLDIHKIQYNKDVGYSILESYSRVLESLAHSVMSRIEDVLQADVAAVANMPNKDAAARMENESQVQLSRKLDPQEEMEKVQETTPMTLYDFMGWHFDKEEMKTNGGGGEDAAQMKKPPDIVTNKRLSYLEKVENFASQLRSPTARH